MKRITRSGLWPGFETRMFLLTVLSAPSVVLFPLTMLPVGVDVYLSTKHDYLVSIRPFVPDFFTKICFYEALAIQAIDLKNPFGTTIYFSGCAVDMILGIVQGCLLGWDLLRLNKRSNGEQNNNILPVLNMFLYSGMCLSAFFVHCLKDVLDVTNPTLAIKFFLWADTWFTSCVYVFMLSSTLLRCGVLPRQTKMNKMIWRVLFTNALLTGLGVASRQTWLIFLLHAVLQHGVGVSILLLEYNRAKRNSFVAVAFIWLLLAAMCSVVFLGGGALLAVPLTLWTGGAYDALTSAFTACRCGMVCYWAFERTSQRQRIVCHDKEN